MAVGEVATRDYVRSELRALLAELDERAKSDQLPAADGGHDETEATPES
jgi:hypothetical protein